MERQQITRISDLQKENSHPGRPRAAQAHLSHPVHQLRSALGNRVFGRFIQAKLKVSEPGDAFEQEADSVARQVAAQDVGSLGLAETTGFSVPVTVQRMIQRQESSFPPDSEDKVEDEKPVQRKADGPAEASSSLEGRLDALAGSGQPLPGAVQAQMEASFGANFEHVRVHTGSESTQLNRSLGAEAFTYGNDIFFGANRFNPGSRAGTELLAHELTHTLQQSGIQRKSIQRRGGTTVGVLSVNTNVVSGGLTAGHAWLAYTPTAGPMTTYGTWGNRTPVGLHRDLELGYSAAATRSTNLDAGDYSNLTSFAASNNAWGYINNCASFAGRGWRAVTGESLSYTNSVGIPNPSSLGAGIVSANGGTTGVLPATPPAAAGGSSSL